jgi:hypothetical protein
MGRSRDHRDRPIIEVIELVRGMALGTPRVRSGREVTAGSQDAGLGCDQATFCARDPAGRLPEREDALSLPLFVCPCQDVTVVFRRLPGVGVHGLPPFVCL